MRILISAMLLASTAALGAPAVAQPAPPPPHEGGDHHGGGDHRYHGGQPPAQAPRPAAAQAGRPNVMQSLPGGQGGYRPQPGQPQGGRADPRFHGEGFEGDRGPGGDPRQQGHAGGDPRNYPGWGNHPGGGDDHARDRPVFQDGRPGYAGQNDGGRFGGYDRGHGGYQNGGGGDWNRGWRNDNRYDWQGYRNAHRDIFRGGGYRAPYGYGYGYRRFGIGAVIGPAFFAQDYWIADPAYYRLPPAYGPYRWVRYYNDALLIDLRSGVVVDAIPGFFW